MEGAQSIDGSPPSSSPIKHLVRSSTIQEDAFGLEAFAAHSWNRSGFSLRDGCEGRPRRIPQQRISRCSC